MIILKDDVLSLMKKHINDMWKTDCGICKYEEGISLITGQNSSLNYSAQDRESDLNRIMESINTYQDFKIDNIYDILQAYDDWNFQLIKKRKEEKKTEQWRQSSEDKFAKIAWEYIDLETYIKENGGTDFVSFRIYGDIPYFEHFFDWNSHQFIIHDFLITCTNKEIKSGSYKEQHKLIRIYPVVDMFAEDGTIVKFDHKYNKTGNYNCKVHGVLIER